MRDKLNRLHNKDGLSWRQIQRMDEYKHIPVGSLCSYASGWEPITDKARRQFGLGVIEMIPQVRDSKSGQFSKRD